MKSQLENDNGTIFMYHHYERDVLKELKSELGNAQDIDVNEKQSLIDWIDKITTGDRKMVDLLELLKNYYYNPRTGGSNSLKDVLPAILNTSGEMQDKYSQAIYGTKKIRSHNFNGKKWIEFNENGEVKDPYELLTKFDYEISNKDEDRIFTSAGIINGGAAMIAYNQMQYTHMTEAERKNLNKALLQYCELDTFAMVLLLEFWNNKIKNEQ